LRIHPLYFPRLSKKQSEIHAALLNNIDTPAAMLSLQDLISKTNSYIRDKQQVGGDTVPNGQVLSTVGRYVTRILRVFGIVESSNDSEIGFGSGAAGGASKSVSNSQ
jgi:cysteinyl-tRNA synthetase